MDIMAQFISCTSFQLDLETLDFLSWFMKTITSTFETRHLSVDSERPLVHSLLRILQLPISDLITQQIVRNTLHTLINLTKCESKVFGREDPRSDFAAIQVVAYEQENMNN
jgi:hypothetical protein